MLNLWNDGEIDWLDGNLVLMVYLVFVIVGSMVSGGMSFDKFVYSIVLNEGIGWYMVMISWMFGFV